ncbi:hypothetical protein [Streptomyces aurantiogriseus]|uniref:Uncharacterized protein n=1 Tax=Streptomyces aurantiogriseus TaxID=66870 RepID=A0A918FD67_9ACTN|nr:hypothetical protein [Streptomyces aurantiogriseus]GGR24282.1 hypothetical protein GCM10010251_45460 [Streptomyces aurantiogriseus]
MIPELLRSLAAVEESGPDIGKILGQFVQYGMVGVFALLMVLGIVVPKWAMTALTTEKDNWRTAFEAERAAHQVTREQLIAAQASVDTANEQGRAMVQLLERLGHRPQTTNGSV